MRGGRRHAATVQLRAGVVGRGAESRLVRADRSRARLVLEEEVELVSADEDGAGGRRYGGGVTLAQAALVVAAVLTATGELEVLLSSAADGERLVSALACRR